MSNRVLAAREKKRLDAMVVLPLGRFRRALIALSPEELTALAKRIGVHVVRNQWARGGHGIERLRANNELGLLMRRRMVIRHELERRDSTRAAQLRLIEP